MCIVNKYILLTTKTKISFSKEVFFDLFEKSNLEGVCVIVGSADLPFERTEKERMKFRLTRKNDFLRLTMTTGSFLAEKREKTVEASFSSFIEATKDLDEFNSYFCEGEVTDKLFIQGYRVYPVATSRLDTAIDVLRNNLKGTLHIPLNERCKIQFLQENTYSSGYLYLYQLTEDQKIREFVVNHYMSSCPEEVELKVTLEQTSEYSLPENYKNVKEDILPSIFGLEMINSVHNVGFSTYGRTLHPMVTKTYPF